MRRSLRLALVVALTGAAAVAGCDSGTTSPPDTGVPSPDDGGGLDGGAVDARMIFEIGPGPDTGSTEDTGPAPDTGPPGRCGDGELTGAEECDDGNRTPDDGCSMTCTLECGDGAVTGAELCDTAIASGAGSCPASCDDGMACTTDTLVGTECAASCASTPITTPASGDGCCPTGATSLTDDDCMAACGNGLVEMGETCDTGIASGAGSCPTSCNDGAVCTTDALANAGTCTAACTATPITMPAAGDGCCPPGATIATDSDCTAACGDGAVSSGETCDTGIASGMGACPTACNDMMVCTRDSLVGAGTCTAACTFTPITAPMAGDGCCPPGATIATDSDCTGRCGDGTVTAPEVCDDGNTTAGDGCSPTCTREPRAFRTTTLTIQEPHFFFVVDITNNVNTELRNALTMDGDMPADGLVDLSPIVYFDPLDQAAMTTPMSVDFGDCTMPLSSTRCMGSGMPTTATATNLTTGTCLRPIAGTFPTGRGINAPAAPCFSSNAVTALTIDLGGTIIRLRNAQIGAQYVGSPATRLATGLIMGFLTEADAMATTLPADIAIVGGRTIASLLRRADRDTLADGTVGWWFYLNYTGDLVPYTP
jgi:cysteine-rich repeat protein